MIEPKTATENRTLKPRAKVPRGFPALRWSYGANVTKDRVSPKWNELASLQTLRPKTTGGTGLLEVSSFGSSLRKQTKGGRNQEIVAGLTAMKSRDQSKAKR